MTTSLSQRRLDDEGIDGTNVIQASQGKLYSTRGLQVIARGGARAKAQASHDGSPSNAQVSETAT